MSVVHTYFYIVNVLALKLYFVLTICHNSDMFRSILIFLRELFNISKAYI